jgi:hypothetical protein
MRFSIIFSSISSISYILYINHKNIPIILPSYSFLTIHIHFKYIIITFILFSIGIYFKVLFYKGGLTLYFTSITILIRTYFTLDIPNYYTYFF